MGFVRVIKFYTDTEVYLLFMKLSSNSFSDKPIRKGEVAVIAHAKKYNRIVASNNTKDVMPLWKNIIWKGLLLEIFL